MTFWDYVSYALFASATISTTSIANLSYLFFWPFSKSFSIYMTAEFGLGIYLSSLAYIFPKQKIIVTGDLPKKDEDAIWIANHQIDSDWWSLLHLLYCLGIHQSFKAILKNEIRYIPFFGWACWVLGFIFLQRDWKKDEKSIRSCFKQHTENNYHTNILLFPEGTTINDRAVKKSDEFSEKNNIEKVKHLIIPRKTGFHGLLNASLPLNPDIKVLDITIAYEGYSGEVPTWEMGYDREKDVKLPSFDKMIRRRPVSERIHIDIRRFNARDIIDDETWLDKRWKTKDELLDCFIHNQKFPEDKVGPSTEFEIKGRLRDLLLSLFILTLPILFYHYPIYLPMALLAHPISYLIRLIQEKSVLSQQKKEK